MSRKKCIVLDLDESLVRTSSSSKGFESLSEDAQKRAYKLYMNEEMMWGVRRPYLEEFFDYCFANFEVGVWSAGDDSYVKMLCDQLFVKKNHKPLFVWGRSKCFKFKDEYLKPLERIFEEFPHIDRHNTLIIDDKESMIRYNEENHIRIPPYTPSAKTADRHDNCLIMLVAFFRKTKEPYTKADKESIFTAASSDE